ncbi:MAG: hypothetical protein ACRERD_21555 [Candidatus Binatia bacterium]
MRTVGGAAVDWSLPSPADASAVEDHVLEREQPDTAEEAALPPWGIARQENASSAAATQQGGQRLASQGPRPRSGAQTGEAWRRMVQNALGIVDLLLAPKSRPMQTGLTTPALQDNWAPQGRVAVG